MTKHADYGSGSQNVIAENGRPPASPLFQVDYESQPIEYDNDSLGSSYDMNGEKRAAQNRSKRESPRSLTDWASKNKGGDNIYSNVKSTGSASYTKTSASKCEVQHTSPRRVRSREKKSVILEGNGNHGPKVKSINPSVGVPPRPVPIRYYSPDPSIVSAISTAGRDEEVPFVAMTQDTKPRSPPRIKRDLSVERRFPPMSRKKSSFSEKVQNENAQLLSTPTGEKKERSPASIRKAYSKQQNIAQMIKEVKGEEQPIACRDLCFAILFYVQLFGIMALGFKFGPDAVSSLAGPTKNRFESTGSIVFTLHNAIYLAINGGITTMAISSLAFALMMRFSKRVVITALWTAIALSVIWTLIGVAFSPKTFIPLTGIVAVGITSAYFFVVWDRIPFARANLSTAFTAVRSNSWIFCIGLAFQVMTLTLTLFYAFTGIGIYDQLAQDDFSTWEAQKPFIIFGLCLSYYWSFRVLVHVVHVTVAGIVHEWWFSNNKTVKIWPSFVRAIFYSFGSVCLGSSLLVGVMRILRQIISFIRRRDFILNSGTPFERFLILCISFIDSKTNHWAFSYVGMYGYGFVEASDRANALFQKRGWKKIVTDDLVGNVLCLVAFVIAGMTGSILAMIEDMEHLHLSSFEKPTRTAFVLGIGTGMVLSIVMFGIILSAVNTVIVNFASSPEKLLVYHPDLYVEMRAAWQVVWPGFVDNIEKPDNPSRRASRGWRENMRETTRMDLGILV